MCSAEIRMLHCKESFFRSKSKSSTVKTLPVSAKLCEQVFQTKQSPYGRLTHTKGVSGKQPTVTTLNVIG